MKKWNAYLVYMLLAGVEALAFNMIVTVNQVYQVEMAGLNALQLVLVGTALEATVFVFEVPTGIVADVYSRRLSVIISMFVVGAGMMLEGSIPLFVAIAAGQMLWGLGATFSSGALEAWVADELGEAQAGHAFVRAAQVSQIGVVIGTLLGVALGSVRINLAVQVGAVIYMLFGLFLIAVMPEHGFKPVPREDRSSFQMMAHTFRGGIKAVRMRPVLITILVIVLIYGASCEGFDRLWVAHLLRDFEIPALGPLQPVAWFGMIRLTWTVLTAVALEIIRRRLDLTSQRAVALVLLVINVVLVAAVIVFALAGSLMIALAAVMLIGPLRRMIDPLQKAWINQRLDSSVRATVLSMSGQMGSLGEIVGGVPMGALALARSLRAAIFTAGLLLIPALGLYGWSGRIQGQAQAQEPGGD